MKKNILTLNELLKRRAKLNAEYQKYLGQLISTDPQAQAYNGALQQLNILIETLAPPADEEE